MTIRIATKNRSPIQQIEPVDEYLASYFTTQCVSTGVMYFRVIPVVVFDFEPDITSTGKIHPIIVQFTVSPGIVF